jgi:hypothetical protein
VTEATDNKIKFVLAHKKYPEYYTMIRQQGDNKPWLMINHTPTSPEQVLGNKDLFSKVHIKSVPAEKAEEFLNGVVEGKVDGASGLFKLKKDSIDVLSYRIGTNGRPIVHTERFFGGKAPTVDVPKNWQNKVLRGEIYGVDKNDQPLSSQEVTPLLNMSLAKSIQNQQDTKTKLRGALFGVAGEDLNTPTRESELKEVLSFLPPQYFDRPPVAHGPEEGMKLWREVEEGKHPEISEGVVVYPESGDSPLKIKLRPEYDVQVSGVFPGEGKYTGSAGGIEYKVPEGVGRVGTGFDDDFRKWLWENKDSLGGRIARITSTKKLPSGKYFQPSFMGLHEDYPTKKAEDDVNLSFLPDYTPEQLKEMDVYKEVYGTKDAPRLASLPEWPAHWYNEADPHGWLQWYDRHSKGRRIEDDKRQIKRWISFKARHGGKAFRENPTPRRAFALRNWGIDPAKLVDDPEALKAVMDEYKTKKYNKKMEKVSFLPKLAKDESKDNVEAIEHSSVDATDYEAHDAYLMHGKKLPGSAMPFKDYFSEKNFIESLPWDIKGGLGAALKERGFQNLRDTMDGNIIMTDKDGNLYTWDHELGGIARGHYNLITDRDMDWHEEYKDSESFTDSSAKNKKMEKVSFLPKLAKDEKPGLWANIRAKRKRGEPPAKPGDKAYPDKEQWSELTKKEAGRCWDGYEPVPGKKPYAADSCRKKSKKKDKSKKADLSFLPKLAKSPAWQRSEGKNSEGGLNAKGRASYNRETGGNLKAPVTEKNPSGKREKRQNSFCSRMCGMKKSRTSAKTKNDPDSRINKALRKWRCRCS